MDCNLICGDSREEIKKLSTKIDLLITDPPYNVGYKYNDYKDNLDWNKYFDEQEALLVEAKRILKPTGSVLWLNYPESAAIMWTRLLKHFHPVEWITWIYQFVSRKP